MADLPVISIFGDQDIKLKSSDNVPGFETSELDCRCYLTDNNFYEVLAKDRPVCIVIFGDINNFPIICNAPISVQKRCIHFENTDDLISKGFQVFEFLIYTMLGKQTVNPLVTVFTPTYNTGDKIMRPFYSLLSQNYKNWEWVIIDDSEDNRTFERLQELAKRDFRIRVYKSSQRSGVIGNLKREACDLGRGEYLLELDHDDEITPQSLELVVKAFQKHPEVGFVYTDFAECFEDGREFMYGEGWGLGYGSYREEIHNGIKYMVVNSPRINAKTIRHIVAAPNHIRAWRKKIYNEIGGHNPLIHVVDDYELMVRTFLNTRIALIPKMCYIQYRNESGNTSQLRNKDIQRLVRYFSIYYDRQIHNRFLELGVDDFVWKDGEISFYRLHIPNPDIEPHCTVILNNL